MKYRHKIKLKLTIVDKAIEVLGWLCLAGIWLGTIIYYPELPEQIPTHYSLAGEADRFNSKTYLLFLPMLASILAIGLTILNRFPHRFNYPAIITPHNAEVQYTNATRMIRFLKLSITLAFGLILFEMLPFIEGDINSLGTWSLPLIFIIILAPIVYFIVLGARRDSMKLRDTKY